MEAKRKIKKIARVSRPNTGSNAEVAMPQVFNGKSEKMSGFITICKLFIRMKISKEAVEEQVQWVL